MKIRIASIVFCLMFISCSTNQEEGAGPLDLDTTEAGVATGALIGAGVGAVVGSTAGEAGAGVILGSIAGATSGGVIGKTIETQEKRIDVHDKRAGISTKKVASNSGSEGSFVDTIWSRSNNSNYNRPSGDKGRAAKFVDINASNEIASFNSRESKFVQIKESRNAPSVPTTIASARTAKSFNGDSTIVSKSSNALPPAVREPVIELQKPKPELPTVASIPSRKPSLSDKSVNSLTYSNLNNVKSARAKLVEPETMPKAKVTEPIQASKSDTIKQESTDVSPEVSKAVNSPVKTVAVCESGEKDLERANKSASDSDKVFYLRRVILACPKETKARLELGKVYSRLGLKEEAKKEFNSILEIDPSDDSAQDEMSIMMLDSRKN